MGLLGRLRRRGPAVDVPPGLDLAGGERVLASAQLAAPGGWAVATDRALLLAGASGPDRRGWETVDHGSWDDDASVLEVTWTDGSPPLRLRLVDGDGSFLPEVLRERVQSTVVVSRRLDLRGRRGVRVAVRRPPGRGALFSEVLVDPGVPLDDPAVARQVDALHRELRSQVGLPPSP